MNDHTYQGGLNGNRHHVRSQCGFTYGFSDEEIEYAGFVCPSCKMAAPCVEVDVDLEATAQGGTGDQWFVTDRAGQPVAGPFASPASASLWTTRNRLWDHPHGPLDIVRQHAPETTPRTTARPGSVEREHVPALIDLLDVRLALWITQSMLSAKGTA